MIDNQLIVNIPSRYQFRFLFFTLAYTVSQYTLNSTLEIEQLNNFQSALSINTGDASLRLFGSFSSLHCNNVTRKWNNPNSSAASLRVHLWPRLHRFVYIWDTTSRRMLYKLPGHAGSVNEVAFHPEEPIGEAKQLVHNIKKINK